MRRALSEQRERKPGVGSDARKYMPGLDPLEKEATISEIQPLGKYEADRMMKYVNRLLKAGKLGKDETAAFNFWKANLVIENAKGLIHQEFMRDFWAWILGKGKESDHRNTPWYRQSLTNDSEVAAYVDSFITKRHQFQMKLHLLRMRHPVGINQTYLYFKYVVRKEAPDADNFLDDWKLFLMEFPKARAAGQAERNKDEIKGVFDGEHNVHEMAPYGGGERAEIGKKSHDRKVDQMIQAGAKSWNNDDMSDEEGDKPITTTPPPAAGPPAAGPPPPADAPPPNLPTPPDSPLISRDFFRDNRLLMPPAKEPESEEDLLPPPVSPETQRLQERLNRLRDPQPITPATFDDGTDEELPDPPMPEADPFEAIAETPNRVPQRLEDIRAEELRLEKERLARKAEVLEKVASKNRAQDLLPVGAYLNRKFAEVEERDRQREESERQKEMAAAERSLVKLREKEAEAERIGLKDQETAKQTELLNKALEQIQAERTAAQAEREASLKRDQELVDLLKERTEQIKQNKIDTDKAIAEMTKEVKLLSENAKKVPQKVAELMKEQAESLHTKAMEKISETGAANLKELDKAIEARQNQLQADYVAKLAENKKSLQENWDAISKQLDDEREARSKEAEKQIDEMQNELANELEKLKKGNLVNVKKLNAKLMTAIGDRLNAIVTEELVENMNVAENRLNELAGQAGRLQGRFEHLGNIANTFEKEIAELHASNGRAKEQFEAAVKNVNEKAEIVAQLQDDLRSKLRALPALVGEMQAGVAKEVEELQKQIVEQQKLLDKAMLRQDDRLAAVQRNLEKAEKRMRQIQKEKVEQSRRNLERIRNNAPGGRFELPEKNSEAVAEVPVAVAEVPVAVAENIREIVLDAEQEIAVEPLQKRQATEEKVEEVKPPEMQKTTVTPPEMQKTTVTPPEMQKTTVTPPEMQKTTVTPPEMQKTTVTPPQMQLMSSLKNLAGWLFGSQETIAENLHEVQENVQASIIAEQQAEEIEKQEAEEEMLMVNEAEQAQARATRIAKGFAARQVLLNELEEAEKQLKEMEEAATEQEQLEYYQNLVMETAAAVQIVKTRMTADQRAIQEAQNFVQELKDRARPQYEKTQIAEKKGSTTPVRLMSLKRTTPMSNAPGRTNLGTIPKNFTAAESNARSQRWKEFAKQNPELIAKMRAREDTTENEKQDEVQNMEVEHEEEQELELEDEDMESSQLVADAETKQALKNIRNLIQSGEETALDFAAQEIAQFGLLIGYNDLDVERREEDNYADGYADFAKRLMQALNAIGKGVGIQKRYKLNMEMEEEREEFDEDKPLFEMNAAGGNNNNYVAPMGGRFEGVEPGQDEGKFPKRKK